MANAADAQNIKASKLFPTYELNASTGFQRLID